jgi:hypothetical protein
MMIASTGRLAALILVVCVGGCGASFHPPLPGDTACLNAQVRDFHVEMYRAVDICGTLPDLTGDTYLQQYAAAWNISYRINPTLDARLKRSRWSEMILIGSLIPGDYGLTTAELR